MQIFEIVCVEYAYSVIMNSSLCGEKAVFSIDISLKSVQRSSCFDYIGPFEA